MVLVVSRFKNLLDLLASRLNLTRYMRFLLDIVNATAAFPSRLKLKKKVKKRGSLVHN